MGVRDIVKFTQERAAAVSSNGRAASQDLFAASGYGAVVTRLDVSGAATPRSTAQQLPDNPIMFGPAGRVATRLGALPIKVYRINESVKEDAPDHPGYGLLRQPNKVIPRNLMVSTLVLDIFGYGKHAWLKVRDPDTRRVVELWPIHAPTLKINADARTLISSFQVTVNGKLGPEIDPADVLYFRLLAHPDNLADGLSPLHPLARIGQLGETAIRRGDKMISKALLSRQWIEFTRELSNRAFKRLQAQMATVRDDEGAIPIMEEGSKMHDLAAPSAEVVMQAISTAQSVIRDTLGLPADGNTKEFLQNAVQPIADAVEQVLELSLFTEWPDDPAFPEFAFRDQLRGDPAARIEGHQKAILSAQETPNEARAAENKPPLEGGDQLFVPLNLVPIDLAEEVADSGVPPEKDTAGGLGGSEGKGTLVAASARMRARAKRSYSTMRDRVVKRNADQLARRLRGVLNKEAKAIKSALNEGRQARAAEAMPSAAELRKIIGRSDESIASILDKFMRQTGDASAPDAADLIGHELTDDALDRLADVYASRAGTVAERFSGVRGDRIIGLVEGAVDKGTTIRDLATQIGEAYSDLSTAYTDGLARTEVAFAHEQAALVTWADAGVTQIEVVDGGGPCTTGVCSDNAAGSPYRLGEGMDNVGYSFEGADAPPFHPGCTCFAVPFVESGRSGEVELRVRETRTTELEPLTETTRAPDVNVNVAAPNITVVMPDGSKRSVKKIQRDDNGNAVAIIEEEV